MTDAREELASGISIEMNIPYNAALLTKTDRIIAALASAGLVVVPKEPTNEMCDAVWDWSVLRYGSGAGAMNYDDSRAIYRAMLTAAPTVTKRLRNNFLMTCKNCGRRGWTPDPGRLSAPPPREG